MPNFDARLRLSLQPSLPVGHPLNIVRPYDIHLDAWRGLSKWSASNLGRKAFVTRAEYDEKGADWFKGHEWGNV